VCGGGGGYKRAMLTPKFDHRVIDLVVRQALMSTLTI
jgi:hypothetical protein